MKTQSGFTLIEMVAVIIILAIMAATALPKFTNLSGEARYSSLNGLVGGLRSAGTLAKAKWLAAQSGNLDYVDFNGTNVSVINLTTAGSSTAVMGYPMANVTGINLAMDSWSTYSSGTEADAWVFWPAGAAVSSSCYAKYQSGTVTIVPATAATAANACS